MSIITRLNERLTGLAVSRHLRRRTVRMRLTLVYGALFLLSGAALVAVTYFLFERATEYRRPQLPHIPHAPTIADLRRPSALAQFGRQLAQAQHQLIFSADGPVRLAQGVAHQVKPNLGLPAAYGGLGLTQDQQQLRQDQHQLTQAVNQLAAAVHQLARAGSVQAAQRAADSHQLLVDSGIALGIVAVLALLAGWFVAGRMLRPLRTITRTARRISSASLHERLALDGPQDELKELGDTLDDLFARLDAAFEAQRQFVANASHELRTPLARQRALIQVALADPQASFSSLRAAHERVLASEQHLEQMIDALLTLTRGQVGLERSERLDLATLASRALLTREAELAGRDLAVRATLSPAPAAGDPRLIERLIANLIDNAIRHNTPHGQIEIATGSDDRRAFVSIANSGPIVAAEEIERIFQPFQRLDGARTRHDGGYGLGLSIVEAIANAHRAALDARPRAQGGLTIQVSFLPLTGADTEVTFPAAWAKRASRRARRSPRPTLRRR